MTEAAVSSAAADVARDLYERHARQVYSICLRQLGSREEAEDAAQTVFLNAFGALRRGSRPRSERAWLRTIAENVCHDRRARAPRTRDLHALEDVLASPEREPGALAGIEQALAQLPDTQRRAIVLREWHGLSYREIAAELGLSEAAAEAVAFRARRTLAERLRSRGNLSLLGWLKPALGGSAAVAKLSVVVGVAAVATGSATPQYVATRDASSPGDSSRVAEPRSNDAGGVAVPTPSASGTVRARLRPARQARSSGTEPVSQALAPGQLSPPRNPSPAPPEAPAGEPATSPPAAPATPSIAVPEVPVDDLPELPVDVPAVPDVPALPTLEPPAVPNVEEPVVPPLEPPAVPAVSVPPVPLLEPPPS